MDKEKIEMLRRQAAQCGYDLGDASTRTEIEQAFARCGVTGERQNVALPITLDEEARTVEAVIATETPVVRIDWDSWELYQEVLPMDGCRVEEIPGGEIPLLNGHQSWGDVHNQLGTTKDIRIEGRELVGKRYFSSADHVKDIWTMVKEGHLKRQSIGYTIRKCEKIKKGAKNVINGREWLAPANMRLEVATDWLPREDSIVIMPADRNTGNRCAAQIEEKQEQQKGENMDNNTENRAPEIDEASIRAASAEIIAICSRHGLTERAAEFIREGKTVDEVRAIVLDEIEKRAASQKKPAASSIVITEDEHDKTVRAFSAVIAERAGYRNDTDVSELRGMTMKDIAAECVRRNGEKVSYDGQKLFSRAMSTTDFPKILSNSVERSLMQGFTEAEETYTAWCDLSGRVNDFREQSVARGIAKFDLEQVREGAEYGYATMGEDGDKVKVAKYGKKIAYTWEAMINDDLDQLTVIPYEFARAARRLEGDMAYDFLTENPNARDGKALFHADHGNLAASGAAPSETAINAGMTAMAIQKDFNKPIYLNPRFIIGPHAIEMTVNKLLNSLVYADSSAASTQVNTVYGRLTAIYDARLDAYGAAQNANPWFLAASPRDTVRFFHLAGHENVFIDNYEDRDRDAYIVKCRHVVGANCSFWQGLYKNAGASR